MNEQTFNKIEKSKDTTHGFVLGEFVYLFISFKENAKSESFFTHNLNNSLIAVIVHDYILLIRFLHM